MADTEVALAVAILTQNQSNKEAEFRKESLELEAQKTSPRRHVAVNNGAFTIGELQDKVESRNDLEA